MHYNWHLNIQFVFPFTGIFVQCSSCTNHFPRVKGNVQIYAETIVVDVVKIGNILPVDALTRFSRNDVA